MCIAVTHSLHVACESHWFKVKHHFVASTKTGLDYMLAWRKKIETLCNPTLRKLL